jgi:peptide deformylase
MLDIIKLGDPNQAILFQSAKPVEDFDGTLHALLDGMQATMKANEGRGLAAPQVGHSLRAIVLGDGRYPEMINPKIVYSKGSERRQEGCLSLPGLSVEVERAEKVVVEAQDRHGKPFVTNVRGPVARLIQHELDHLNGLLISRFAQ